MTWKHEVYRDPTCIIHYVASQLVCDFLPIGFPTDEEWTYMKKVIGFRLVGCKYHVREHRSQGRLIIYIEEGEIL